MSSLLLNAFLTKFISLYMPSLQELVLQPQVVLGYKGHTPAQMLELARLPHLRRLSLTLSVRDLIMNMPEIVFVLREFLALRSLVLSWGRNCDAYDLPESRALHMMGWLRDALKAENADIRLQLSYDMHRAFYTRNAW